MTWTLPLPSQRIEEIVGAARVADGGDAVEAVAGRRFDAVLCCVSIDYLTRPVEVLAEVARVLRPGAPAVLTFSNRCFPTKAVHAWLATDDGGRCELVAEHLRRTGGFAPAEISRRTPAGAYRGDPLFAVVARVP